MLDLEMPGRNGLTAIPDVRRMSPSLKIIIVSMLVDRDITDAALAAGAHGFVPKDSTIEELHTAISEVLAGRVHISARIPKVTHVVGLSAAHRALHRLTPRQQQIVLMLGDGKCAAEIADELGLGPSTITFHKGNIMRVLGMNSEAELLKYAVLVKANAAAAS